MTRLLVKGDEEEDTFSLEDLKSVSTLHVLAITDAPLKIVQYVHEDNPDALTQDVFLDACTHCHSLYILRYLKEQAPPEYYAPDKIAPIMRDILKNSGEEEVYDVPVQVQILATLFPEGVFLDICRHSHSLDILQYLKGQVSPENYTPDKIAPIMCDILDSGDLQVYDIQVEILATLFPEAMIYSGAENNTSPLDTVLFVYSDVREFPVSLLEHMLECMPSTIKSFSLPSISENENVEDLYTTIATALAKSNIETFYWEESRWNGDFVDIFTVLLPGARNLKTLEISVPGKHSPADQSMFDSFPTEWLKTSQISTLFLHLGDDRDSECPDFGMLPWLAQMKQQDGYEAAVTTVQ